MKKKYVEERFGGIWFTFGGDTVSMTEEICSPANELAAKRYNDLLDFAADMAVAWSNSDNDEFVKFYYKREAKGE